MENGGSNLADKFSVLAFNDSNNNDGLFQVMKAVEAAEATIKQQVEENNRLRSELLKKNHELEKYVTIPCGNPTDFSIFGSGGIERLLRAENSSTDIACSRDAIVLTLRLFIIRAGDKKKGKKSLIL